MSDPTAFRVRRANVEDLNALVEMWSAMRFDVIALEKRLTEFQVAEAPDGKVVGGVGFLMLGHDGLIHHEAFSNYALADAIRLVLWGRLERIADNHGLNRVWTQEEAPFWDHNGLLPATPELLEKLPTSLDRTADWLVVQLREEAEHPKLPAEEDFEKFLEVERAKTDHVLERARTMKSLAMLVAVVLFIGVMALSIYLFFRIRAPVP